MRLQIKKLDGPDEIRLNTAVAATYAATITANTTENRFTAYFNRAITAADVFPMVVTVKVYNNEGTEQNTFALSVNRTNVNHANTANANFCFTVTLNSPQALSGSYFHVHAVITNADANAQNVGYGVSSYHQTIKKVFIYADKVFNQIYWSSNEQITDLTTQESLRTGNIGQNEDAFLHIKTTGMYEDTIGLVIHANDNIILIERRVTLSHNKKVLAFDMANVIQKYRQVTRQPTSDVSFTLKATVAVANPDAVITNTATTTVTATAERNTGQVILETLATIVLSPLLLFSGCSSPNNRETGSASNTPAAPDNRIITRSTGTLNVSCTNANPAVKRSSTGTVYVNVVTSELEDITPTRFTDFTIGYIVHIEGVGKIVERNDNDSINNQARTVYPYHIYEYLLSDLVVIGAITIEDAVFIAPPPATQTDEARRQQRTRLQENFNKFTQRIVDNSLLINKFRDPQNRTVALRERINGTFVRKLLAQARVRNATFSDFICRDAWQDWRTRANGRYDSGQECPSGEYFLNYIPRSGWANNPDGTPKYDRNRIRVSSPMYRIGTSQILVNSNIYTYHNQGAIRTGIALHNGGPTAAVGCITFNTPHNYDGNENFINAIYQVDIGADGTRIDSARTNRNADRKKINLLCADERNAIQENRDRRFYDLIDRNRNITQ